PAALRGNSVRLSGAGGRGRDRGGRERSRRQDRQAHRRDGAQDPIAERARSGRDGEHALARRGGPTGGRRPDAPRGVRGGGRPAALRRSDHAGRDARRGEPDALTGKMGWDEAVFGWFYGKARALARPRPTPAEREREATLEALSARLRLFACALAERPIDVREAEDAGGFIGATLLLPSAMRHAPSREENERAYRLRVAWSVAALRTGLVSRAREPLERALATTLAAPATRAALLASFPGIEDALLAHEALARIPGSAQEGAARALSALQQIHLGADRAILSSLSSAPRE